MANKEGHLTILRDMPAAVAAGLIHPSYHHIDPVLPEDLKATFVDAESYAEGARVFGRSFPDQKSDAIWVLAEGDFSACRWRFTGTFTGEPFYGVQPNGKVVVYEGMTIYRWRDSQVIEGMSLYDHPGFMRQLQP